MHIFTKVISTSLIVLASAASFAEVVDMNTWSQVGNAADGDWSVAADGYSVIQNVNGNPTYFIGPESYLDAEFNGSFGVETTSDDDFIGFVFGYTGLNDFYLFDWKQGTQGSGQEGFALSKITGTSRDMWAHTGTGIDVLATSYGSARGWQDNTSYQYSLGYTSSGVVISIDGGDFDNEEIFNLSGMNNSAGQMGFYNFSQGAVRYIGSKGTPCDLSCGTAESLAHHTLPVPPTAAFFGLGLLGFSARRKKAI
jgi:hypothetical protein